MENSYNSLDTISVNNKDYKIYNLLKISKNYNLNRLPFSIKILLENLLRKEDGINVTKNDIEAILKWDPTAKPSHQIAFTPSRVILQDFTGVPAIVDLAAMRDAMQKFGKDPKKINPLSPVELVIDHSVMVDSFGNKQSFITNTEKEFERNAERYTFLRWGQNAFNNFKVVPPGTGIVHQVNLEYLARVVFSNEDNIAYPDTLVGTDSHTTMINGIGVLGWGVGGIEAEAAMLGQPITMLIPQVVGFKLKGKMPTGVTATDLVLTVVQMLREKGVVGKFVEFFGEGLKNLSIEDRATIANMAPEYGATCGIFPIDEQTISFLELSGRNKDQINLIEQYAKTVGLFHDNNTPDAEYSDLLELDLNSIKPCIAGPKRPQDKIELKNSKADFNNLLNKEFPKTINAESEVNLNGENVKLKHGDVVIAAITSCTNTSNPSVMLAAGLVAKKANELGLKKKPWVKTSLAPGSQVVTDYFDKANLTKDLEALGFNLVGYGCTTCIGNSGPLQESIENGIKENKLAVSAVLSGNRNFEGRIHPEVKYAYLASPPLVVIYAIAGTMNIDLSSEPVGKSKDGKDIFLKDLWPTNNEIQSIIHEKLSADMFSSRYAHVFEGPENWQTINAPTGESFAWDNNSTYVQNPPYFSGMELKPKPIENINNAKVLALVADSITTDHISPAGSIAKDSPAGKYLLEKGIEQKDFNSYGSRRGNHEIMMRGTFANVRFKNQLVAGIEGGWTIYHPTGEKMYIYDAAMLYQKANIPTIVIAGKEYGSGSSRDWAAKGPRLLGVKVVIAESYERIHRSNLIGMGVLPLQFKESESAKTIGLDGSETFDFNLEHLAPQTEIIIKAKKQDDTEIKFTAISRIDTPKEMEYYENGGILHYVLRNLAQK